MMSKSTPTHCIACDKPASLLGAVTMDSDGAQSLIFSLCQTCTAKYRCGYSDAVSDRIHARFRIAPYMYFAERIIQEVRQ